MNQRFGFLNRNSKGRILYPRNRDLTPRRFQAEGTVDSMPAGQHLLLVVEVGGLLWPKSKVQVDGTSWSAEVYEGGTPPNGNFTLSLYMVSSQGYDEISAWLERGKSTGSYPGLVHIKNGIKLDSINLRLELS
jgi:hypothetical protein